MRTLTIAACFRNARSGPRRRSHWSSSSPSVSDFSSCIAADGSEARPPRRSPPLSEARLARAVIRGRRSSGASSQHKHAMQHATGKTVLGDFNDASFDYYGVRSRFFRKDGKFFVETDGPDGKLATFEVKYTFGVDPLQQYLIEFPDGRLPSAVDRLGQPREGTGRPALVSSLSERGDQARRSPALDQAEPELELHVRGVPFDRRAQELRCSHRPLRHELCGDQRRLRDLSRPGLAPRRLGARPQRLVAVRKDRRIQRRD